MKKKALWKILALSLTFSMMFTPAASPVLAESGESAVPSENVQEAGDQNGEADESMTEDSGAGEAEEDKDSESVPEEEGPAAAVTENEEEPSPVSADPEEADDPAPEEEEDEFLLEASGTILAQEVSTAAELADALTNGEYCKLVNDITTTSGITIPGGVSSQISLNGYTLTLASRLEVSPGAALTINGDGAVNYKASTEAYLCSNGTTILNGGTYNVGDKSLLDYGNMTVNHATVTGTGDYLFYVYPCKNGDGSAFVINSGNFSGSSSAFKMDNRSYRVEITGGTFSTKNVVYLMNGMTERNIDLSQKVSSGYGLKDNGDGTWTVVPVHTCSGLTFINALTTDGGILTDGNYYLYEDVTLTKNLVIEGDVNLCLNGHTLTGKTGSSVIRVENGGTLGLYDCNASQDEGVITGADADRGGAVYVEYGGTFTMNDGTIENCTADKGAGVYNAGTFAMKGGVIRKNQAAQGGGIYEDSTALTFSGTVTVTGNEDTAGNNSNLFFHTDKTAKIQNLDSASSLGLTMETPGIFVNEGADSASRNVFTLDGNNEGYYIALSGSTLKLAKSVSSITLDKTTDEILCGEEDTLTAAIDPEDVEDPTIVWSTSDEKVAAVDQNGVVKAVAYGTATITAASKEDPAKTASCTVKTLRKENYILFAGESVDDQAPGTEAYYCGEAVTIPEPKAYSGSVEQVIYDQDDNKVDEICDAGSYRVIWTAEQTDTYEAARREYDVTIRPNPVTVTVASVENRDYDGTVEAEGTLSFEPTEPMAVSETLTGTGTILWTSEKAGTDTVDVRDIALDDSFAKNYELTADNAKLYDITAPNGAMIRRAAVELPEAVSGLTYDGEIQTGVEAVGRLYTLTGNTGKNAGAYTAEASLKDPVNYEWEGLSSSEDQKISWTIAKKAVTVKADNKTAIKGSALKALTYKASGLVGSDTLTGKLSTNAKVSVPGTYEITQGTLKAGANYTMTFRKATYKVTISYLFMAKGTAGNKKITLTWDACPDADGYDIYYNKCGKYEYIKLASTKKLSLTVTKLNNSYAYRFIIYAYRMVDGKKTTLTHSPVCHVALKNYKYTNAKSIVLGSTSCTMKVGTTAVIDAKILRENSRKSDLIHNELVRYYSDNNQVATAVNGVISAFGKGTCHIYAVANNGVSRKITVTVR